MTALSQEPGEAVSIPEGPREPPPRPKRICIGLDCTPNLNFGCIVIAGVLPDGRILVERGYQKTPDGEIREDHRAGQLDWMIPRVVNLRSRHRVAAVIIDPISPASVLIPAAEKAGLEPVLTSTRDLAQAFGLFIKWVTEGQLVHLGRQNADLRNAVAGAARREIGDGQYAWARKSTNVDISPLCAATLAAWGAHKFGRGYNVLNSVV